MNRNSSKAGEPLPRGSAPSGVPGKSPHRVLPYPWGGAFNGHLTFPFPGTETCLLSLSLSSKVFLCLFFPSSFLRILSIISSDSFNFYKTGGALSSKGFCFSFSALKISLRQRNSKNPSTGIKRLMERL